MGLFDFIKKKLFGKSKKVEESKKVLKDSPKDISVKPKPKPKKKDEPKPKKLVSKKKESKKEEKGFISKIKDAIISSPKKVEPQLPHFWPSRYGLPSPGILRYGTAGKG